MVAHPYQQAWLNRIKNGTAKLYKKRKNGISLPITFELQGKTTYEESDEEYEKVKKEIEENIRELNENKRRKQEANFYK